MDPETPAGERSRMIAALVERRVPNLAADLQALLGEQALRGLALRSLAAYDDPATPETILRRYREYLSRRAGGCDRNAGGAARVGESTGRVLWAAVRYPGAT